MGRWLPLLCLTLAACLTPGIEAKNLFVVGGSGFMGRLFIERAVERGDRIWMLNRGLSSPDFMLGNPAVTHLRVDRFNSTAFRESVAVAARTVPEGRWDAVIDFTAFQVRPLDGTSLYGTVVVAAIESDAYPRPPKA